MTSFQSILLHWLDQWLTFTLIKSISGHLFSLFTQENLVIGLFLKFEGWKKKKRNPQVILFIPAQQQFVFLFFF